VPLGAQHDQPSSSSAHADDRNRPYSGCNVILLWMAQSAGYRTPRFLTFKQASELGGNVRKGKHGTKVYFVKQLQVRDQSADDKSSMRLIPMLREYTVFNVDQCESLPDSVNSRFPDRLLGRRQCNESPRARPTGR
jgi:antirestriction protein ArdC